MPPIATRPATISELAAAAASSPAPPGRDLKYYIRLAETHRKTASAYLARAKQRTDGPDGVGLDMERAFIEFARAATLIVETIPMHREYAGTLNAEQKVNLTQNGQDLLQNLGELKSGLVDRYEYYAKSPQASADAIPVFKAA
ncbi:hypothetical protein R3P38DRAFT_190344 [Favolaschia claudopus]|uniref:USP8 dimerisation domain-containing protein n=1 Tax=Favolaschia claudopus TaxID=2862362 RepID=A0AAW0D2W9_9AGAR